MPSLSKHTVPAVVVGLCAHGLQIVRELYLADVPVIALESDFSIPGTKTGCATICTAADINGPGLIDELDKLAGSLAPGLRPVLFLTNDRMVQTVADAVDQVNKQYRLSWADSAARLAPLLSKNHIEGRCRLTGLNYPESRVLSSLDQLPATLSHLHFPVICKPVQPLSAFKTLVATQPHELANAHDQLRQCLPLLIQEFIPGGDGEIHFGALLLDHGKILARFEGRKLHSRPMGHTTIGVSEPNEEIHKLTKQFFEGLELSGPVSLELKRAPDGRFWIIEPTLGRTDFWAGLCSANGVPLAAIEYASMTGIELPRVRQGTRLTWINGERFPGAVVWLLVHEPRRLVSGTKGVYFDLTDPQPFINSARRAISALPYRALRKAKSLLSRHT